MSKAKDKGTAVETATVTYLRASGFPGARRLPLTGAMDKGDVEITNNPLVIAECKYAGNTVMHLPWTRELDVEVTHAGAAYGLLVVKTPGVGLGNPGRFLALAPKATFVELGQRYLRPDEPTPLRRGQLKEYLGELAAGAGDRWVSMEGGHAGTSVASSLGNWAALLLVGLPAVGPSAARPRLTRAELLGPVLLRILAGLAPATFDSQTVSALLDTPEDDHDGWRPGTWLKPIIDQAEVLGMAPEVAAAYRSLFGDVSREGFWRAAEVIEAARNDAMARVVPGPRAGARGAAVLAGSEDGARRT